MDISMLILIILIIYVCELRLWSWLKNMTFGTPILWWNYAFTIWFIPVWDFDYVHMLSVLKCLKHEPLFYDKNYLFNNGYGFSNKYGICTCIMIFEVALGAWIINPHFWSWDLLIN